MHLRLALALLLHAVDHEHTTAACLLECTPMWPLLQGLHVMPWFVCMLQSTPTAAALQVKEVQKLKAEAEAQAEQTSTQETVLRHTQLRNQQLAEQLQQVCMPTAGAITAATLTASVPACDWLLVPLPLRSLLAALAAEH
jgi:hypothetical protein